MRSTTRNAMLFRGNCFLLLILIINIVNTEPISQYKCPSGSWIQKGHKCYKWGTSPKNYQSALQFCVTQNATLQNIESKEENEYFREDGSNVHYWLGSHTGHCPGRSCSFNSYSGQYICPTTCSYSIPVKAGQYTNWGHGSTTISVEKGNLCAAWHVKSGHWYIQNPSICSGSSYLYLCETRAECKDGYFGSKCSHQCHCLGVQCSENNVCNYGCQKGWTGDRCTKRKMKPRALYYCFNTKNGGKVMIFRADLMGTNFRRIRAVDSNDTPSCSKRQFKRIGDRLTIKIVERKTGFHPKCGEEKISENTFRWKFEFKEFPLSRSAYDVTFVTTCNFASSDSFKRSAITESKDENQTKPMLRTNVTVDLSVEDPYTGKIIQSATLGTQARLVLNLTNYSQDMGVQAISPHTCVATTEDGKMSVQLLDEYGCQVNDSQLVLDGGNGISWWFKLFEVFTFPGYDHVTFSCRFRVCFMENVDQCNEDNVCRPGVPPINAAVSSANRNVTAGTRLSIA